MKGSWWIDLRLGGKRRRIKSPHQTKDAARDYEAILRTEYAKRGSLDGQFEREDARKKQEITFSEFSGQWMRDYSTPNNKPSTVYAKQRALARHLIPFFGERSLSRIDAMSIEQFKASQLASGLKAKTVNNHLTFLRKCLSTALDWELIAKVPRCRPLKAAQPPFRYLSETETRALISAAPPGLWHAMIVTAARTGLRVSELTALRWQDVDLNARMLCVAQSRVRGVIGIPKSNMIRHVPLTTEVVAALRSIERVSGLVFHSDGSYLRETASLSALARVCRACGIEPVGWHALRHTFASQLAQRGASVQSIKALLGHSTIEMTMRYAHLSRESLLGAVHLLERENGHQMGTKSPVRDGEQGAR